MIAAPGNDAVVSALETLLAEAKQGRAGYFVGVMIGRGMSPRGGYFGNPELEGETMKHLELLAGQWEAALVNRALPEDRPQSTADRWVFNVPRGVVSFDFIAWLVHAEMIRRRENAPGPLKIGFWFGRDGNSGLELPSRVQMFEHIARPALALVGAVEDQSCAHDGRWHEVFTTGPIVDSVLSGEKLPKLRATENARTFVRRLQLRNPVTITLREATHYPHRNSNMAAWLKFAQWLTRRGEQVVFVRDTEKADVPIEGYRTVPDASRDLVIRQALYESAKMNLFVSNGPLALAEFSDYPWLAFMKPEQDGHQYAPATPTFWRRAFGIEVGSQFPWSHVNQRIVWQGDDYENLVAAWNEMAERMQAARVA